MGRATVGTLVVIQARHGRSIALIDQPAGRSRAGLGGSRSGLAVTNGTAAVQGYAQRGNAHCAPSVPPAAGHSATAHGLAGIPARFTIERFGPQPVSVTRLPYDCRA